MGVALCAALVSPVFAGEWSATAGWGLRLDQHWVIPSTPGDPKYQVRATVPAIGMDEKSAANPA